MLLQDVIAHDFGHAVGITTGTIDYTGANKNNPDTPQRETQAIEWERKAAEERARQHGTPRHIVGDLRSAKPAAVGWARPSAEEEEGSPCTSAWPTLRLCMRTSDRRFARRARCGPA